MLQMTVSAMNEVQSESLGSWKEHFMACLTVPVFADMRQKEAIALRDKNKPDSLFRYRPLDNGREFSNIERQQVWLSQPFYVNDPFDSSFSILHQDFVVPKAGNDVNLAHLTQVVGDKLSESEISEIAKFPNIPDERFRFLVGKAFPKEPPEFAITFLKVIRKVSESSRTEHVDRLNEFLKQNLSVCCFCETRDSILMWTHYADEHRGCCVEFDVRGQFIPDAVGHLLPVIYKDELFNVTPYYSAIASEGGNNWANMLAACHKKKDWDYEREWRIVFPFVYPDGSNNFSIPIKSITAGLRADRRVQERLFEIAQKLQVPFYKTLKSRTEAKLIFELVTELS
jgi:Protein of unknown function (DUF2971)